MYILQIYHMYLDVYREDPLKRKSPQGDLKQETNIYISTYIYYYIVVLYIYIYIFIGIISYILYLSITI